MANNRKIAELVKEYSDNQGETSCLSSKLRDYGEGLGSLVDGLGNGVPKHETRVVDAGICVENIACDGPTVIGLDLLSAVAADLRAYRRCLGRKRELDAILTEMGLSGLIVVD